MPQRFEDLLRDRLSSLAPWRAAASPLLVLVLSVIASVSLISACMAMLSPEAEGAAPRIQAAATSVAVARVR